MIIFETGTGFKAQQVIDNVLYTARGCSSEDARRKWVRHYGRYLKRFEAVDMHSFPENSHISSTATLIQKGELP